MTKIMIEGGNSKSRQFRVIVSVFCELCHGDIHLHKVSRKYLKQFSSYRVDHNNYNRIFD